MATTTAALRRHDHRFVSAGGKPDRRRFLSLSAAIGSFEDICNRAPLHQKLRLSSGRFIPPRSHFLGGLAVARLPAQGEPSNRFALVSRRRLGSVRAAKPNEA